MNYYRNPSNRKTVHSGFIALVATVIISVILLVMTVQEGSAGWYARFNVLGTEAKEQANALAEGCSEQALAAIITNPNYVGNEVIRTVGGECKVSAIEFNSPAPGFVTIKTQAVVRGAYTNLSLTLNINKIHRGTSIEGKGTLIVYTHVEDASAPSSAFKMHVQAAGASPSDFDGSNGVVVTMDVGHYKVTQETLPGYSATLSSECEGTMGNRQLYFCTVTNKNIAAATTLTLTTSVINDNHQSFRGTKSPSDVQLFLTDTQGVEQRVQSGFPVSGLTQGTYTVRASSLSGYTPSGWGLDCGGDPHDTLQGSVTLAPGDSKTCHITYDDTIPFSAACADTVVMLDRTGSIFNAPHDLYAAQNEARAAKELLDIYTATSPSLVDRARVAIGSFSDLYNRYADWGASVPAESELTNMYGESDQALEVFEKFAMATKPPNNAWTGAAKATNEPDGQTAFSSSKGDQQGYGNFGFTIPSDVTVKGIEVVVKGRAVVGTGQILVSLSSDNGVSWTSSPHSVNLTGTLSNHATGGSYDLWGTGYWSAANLSDAKFIVRIQNNVTNGTLVYVDSVQVNVSYAAPATGLYDTINKMMVEPSDPPSTNLASAIKVGTAELNSSRHRADKKKVLILVSDGIANMPLPVTTAPAMALREADNAKLNAVSIYTVHFGSNTGRDLLAELASGTETRVGHQPGSKNDIGLSMAQGDITRENTDDDNFFIAPASADMIGLFKTIAQKECILPIDPTPPTTPPARIQVVTMVRGGSLTPADFTTRVNATNASKSSFAGKLTPVTVTVDPGSYSITEDDVGGYAEQYGAACSSAKAGLIAAGETRTCVLTNDYIPPPPPPSNFNIDLDRWQEFPRAP